MSTSGPACSQVGLLDNSWPHYSCGLRPSGQGPGGSWAHGHSGTCSQPRFPSGAFLS